MMFTVEYICEIIQYEENWEIKGKIKKSIFID